VIKLSGFNCASITAMMTTPAKMSTTKTTILGFEVIDDLISPPLKKLGFVSIWFSFAFALYLLNRYA
jgi:hypothetical protein